MHIMTAKAIPVSRAWKIPKIFLSKFCQWYIDSLPSNIQLHSFQSLTQAFYHWIGQLQSFLDCQWLIHLSSLNHNLQQSRFYYWHWRYCTTMRDCYFIPSEPALNSLDEDVTCIHTKFCFCLTNYFIESTFLNPSIGKPNSFILFRYEINQTNISFFRFILTFQCSSFWSTSCFTVFILHITKKNSLKRQYTTDLQIHNTMKVQQHHITSKITFDTFQLALKLVSKIYLALMPLILAQRHCIVYIIMTLWQRKVY